MKGTATVAGQQSPKGYLGHNPYCEPRYDLDKAKTLMCEVTKAGELFESPRHPYTQALLSAIPRLGHRKPEHIKLKGEVPTPIDLPSGCVFHRRCLYAEERCSVEIPKLIRLESGVSVACHGVEEGRL